MQMFRTIQALWGCTDRWHFKSSLFFEIRGFDGGVHSALNRDLNTELHTIYCHSVTGAGW